MKKTILITILFIISIFILSCEKTECYECKTVIRTYYHNDKRLVEYVIIKIYCDTNIDMEYQFNQELYPPINTDSTYTTFRTICKKIKN